jgi:menaquinol-cytochrome c reductase iron-sulfur subunit
MNQSGDNQRPDSPADPHHRRSFLTSIGAVVFGGVAAIFPFAAGLGVLVDPLRRQTSKRAAGGGNDATAKFVRVGPLDLLPDDGVPRQFAVTEDSVDAWTRILGERVGTVFLSRTKSAGEPIVTAFSSACPHLGCAVDFNAATGQFECPCHKSAFDNEGRKLFGPTLRNLDPLAVKIVDANGLQEVWVAYERFRSGIAERIPLA